MKATARVIKGLNYRRRAPPGQNIMISLEDTQEGLAYDKNAIN